MTGQEWEILIVRHGQRNTTRSDAYLNYDWYSEPDAEYTMGYYLWVIRNAETTILVDTGYAAAPALARNREVLVDPLTALQHLGVTTSPDALILTHAHYDHIGNVDRIAPGRAYIARKEYEFWTGPLARKPLFTNFVEPGEIAELVRLLAAGTLELIDGVVQVAEGVRMIPVGGHTPGQSIVEVDTPAGTVLLASDAGHFHEEIEKDMLFKSMADWPTSYGVLERIRDGAYAGVISGHDISELDRHDRLEGTLGTFASTVKAAHHVE